MSGAIPQRMIKLSVKLAQNTQTGQPSTFAGSGLDSIDISGLRCSARIRNAYMSNAQATVKVWGLPASLMNQLSSLGMVVNDVPKNILTISAGDEQNGMFIVFSGTIWSAYGEYENQPDVGFTMEAVFGGGIYDVVAAKPTSYPQSFTVADALKSIAQQMGMTLKNYGVNITMPPMYLSGSPAVQARKVANAARVDVGYDGTEMTLTSKKKGRDDDIIEISPATGMISYPAFTQQGLLVKTIFDSRIKFKSKVRVQSSVLSAITQIKNAQGANYPSEWIVNKVDLDLDAMVPKGQWMSTIYAMNPGAADVAYPPAS